MSPIFKVPKQTYSPMRDYIRIAVLVVMLVVVLGMFLVLQTQVKRPAHSQEDVQPPAAGAGGASPPPGGDSSPRPVAIADTEEEELLGQVRDDAPLANDKQPYYYMLAKIFNMSQAQIESKVDASLIPFDCLSDPKACRGKFLRFDGSLWRLHEVPMSPESGFDTVYEATIARQGPVGGPYVFCTIVLTQKPDPGIQPQKSEVVFSGVFFKRIVYENQGAPDDRGVRNLTMSPLFIGKRLDVARPRPLVGRAESFLFFGIGLVALGLFAYLILFRSDKSTHERHFALPSEEDEPEPDATEGGEEAEEASPDAEPDQPPDAEEKPNE